MSLTKAAAYGGNEISACTGKASTLEDVDDIVPALCVSALCVRMWNNSHHDVHTSKLGPHLKRSAQHYTASDGWLEQIEIGFGTFFAFECDLLSDFRKFELHQFVVGISSTVKVSENFEGIIFTNKYVRNLLIYHRRKKTYCP